MKHWRKILLTGSLAIAAMVASSPVSAKAYVFLHAMEESSKVNHVSLLERVVYSLNVASRPAA